MMKLLLIALLASFSHISAKKIPSCAAVLCLVGNECDPLTGKCVPVTCDAKDACKKHEECVPTEFECITNPCPQFECVPKRPIDKCAFIRCSAGHECDSITGKCVPVSCEAKDACKKDETCVPTEVLCIRAPCPQFVCQPSKNDDCCYTSCGKPVDCGESFQDDGPNFCNACQCDKNGAKICTEIGCDESDPKAVCEDESCCKTTCGLPIPCGEKFQDDGANYCNKCKCTKSGVSCTKKACALDDALSSCDPDCVVCTQVVPKCKKSCKKCNVVPQTCHKCSYAECLD